MSAQISMNAARANATDGTNKRERRGIRFLHIREIGRIVPELRAAKPRNGESKRKSSVAEPRSTSSSRPVAGGSALGHLFCGAPYLRCTSDDETS
jgi:hypothetical protein